MGSRALLGRCSELEGTAEFGLLCGFKWKLARFKVPVQKTPAEIFFAAEAVGL